MWKLIGERIGKLRQKQNLSRKQFGEMVGISGQYLGLVERGKRGLSVCSIVKICGITGASADHILFGRIYGDLDVDMLNELSHEQIEIVLKIVKQITRFVNSEDGNETLIQNILSDSRVGTETVVLTAEQ